MPKQAPPSRRDTYHHGNLRAALIEASFDVLAEQGPEKFSVAKVAKRLAVSSAAPYRHFADRDQLLAAVATQAAVELTELIRSTVSTLDSDPAQKFAATAGTYVRYAITRGAAFNVIFAADLQRELVGELGSTPQDLIDLLLGLAQDAANLTPEQARRLLDQYLASTCGYADLYNLNYFVRYGQTLEDVEQHAIDTTLTLIRGWKAVTHTDTRD